MSKAEKFISDRTRNCSNEIIGGGWNNGEFVHIFKPWLTPGQARMAVEIAREEMVEKACEYLEEHTILSKLTIEDFRKALKEG